MQEILHSLTIEQQRTVTVTGVESVTAFSDTQISLTLCKNGGDGSGKNGGNGGSLYITGSGLKITGFSKASGTFTATGTISGARYGGKNLRSRLFK